MKQFVFLVRDPGAYSAIYPVYLRLSKELQIACKMFCFGTAAAMNEAFSVNECDAEKWICEHIQSIDVLICGTGFQTEWELSMMEKCQNHGICTVAVLDYWSNYKKRFIVHDRTVWPDIYAVMDSIAREEAIAEGVPANIIKILGHPGLDNVLERKRTIQLHNHTQYNSVLLLGQPITKEMAFGYDAALFFENCIEILKHLGMQFCIKFHPRDDRELKEKYGLYCVEGDLLDTALQYDIIIGMTTMALLYTALIGLDSVSYQPALSGPDVCISNKLGLSKLITSKDELLEFLSNPVFSHAKELKKLIWMDGKSTRRFVNFLKEL